MKQSRLSLVLLVVTFMTIPNFVGAYGATKAQVVKAAFENYIEEVNSTYNTDMMNAVNHC